MRSEGAPKYRVLIVDDDPDIRASFRAVLEREGYTVDDAEHGQAALDLLEKGAHPAVIVSDLDMPVMNGWQLRRELSKSPSLACIPLVIASTPAVGVGHARARLAATAFLHKPVDLWELLGVVARLAAPQAS